MPNRHPLLTLLNRYVPTDPEEVAAKAKMLEFAMTHSDCFERSLVPGHFTASCWLLSKDGTKALLMHHAKIDKWVQPGGHADGDNDLLAVAVKEAQEESGIQSIAPVSTEIFDLDIHDFPARGKDPAHVHYDVRFLLQVMSDEDFVRNAESKELRWISQDAHDLPTQARSVTRMFEKWIALKNGDQSLDTVLDF
jgi:8-oxo-dGTP pyrophosphatase MutT (NUDIX family)